MKTKPILVFLGLASVLHSGSILSSTIPLHPKIDKYIYEQFKTNHQSKNSVLVVLKEQADLTQAESFLNREEKKRYVYNALRNKALATQGPLIDFLQSKKVSFRRFYIENMIAVENPTAELVKELAARKDVARIMGNPLVKLKLPKTKATLATSHKTAGPEKNLVRIGATTVWKDFDVRGEGIVVAGQDTGVQWDHPALVKQYRGSSSSAIDHNYNWHDAIHAPLSDATKTSSCGYNTKAPCDDQGHGTHTMGTIVGDDGEGNQIGVAPKAQWMACKNMDNGIGSPATYIECFEFFLAPYPINGDPLKDGDPSKAPHVINNSWGCTPDEGCSGDEILPSLKAMKNAGIFVVASAGNDGPYCSSVNSPPAWHSGLSLTVGAFDHRDDEIAYFSSRGPSALDNGIGPNIAAPGVSIRSSVPGNRYASFMWSGTSMAGPHAVGAVALLWSLDKNLIGNFDKTLSLIEQNAEPKTTSENCGDIPGSHVPNNTYGSGLLNVSQAACALTGKCGNSFLN